MSEIPQENILLKKRNEDVQIFGIDRQNHYYPDKTVLLQIGTTFTHARQRISKRVFDTFDSLNRLARTHLRNK